MRERDIEAYFKRQVENIGGEVRKVNWVGRRGAPDRVALLPTGEVWWVELKATGKHPQPHQVREHIRMRKMGQRVYIVDSFEGTDSLLNSYKLRTEKQRPKGFISA